jgi:plasmid stabilization system protein ParE/AraC-like DNA-binding protein
MSDTHQSKNMLKVGAERANALLYTGGVGALIDLPNMSVIVRGLDSWDHTKSEFDDLTEPRLLRNVRAMLGRQVTALKPAPFLERQPGDQPTGDHARVGVPVSPFPRWLRCSKCDFLSAIAADGGTGAFIYENHNPYRPDAARFVHESCHLARKAKRKPTALPARFVLVCKDGHLDDFPYGEYVHQGKPCTKGVDGKLAFFDPGTNLGSAITIYCNCKAKRSLRDALRHHHRTGSVALPVCRGRHPHLGSFDDEGCGNGVRAMVLGASNQWFSLIARALYIPDQTNQVNELVTKHWPKLSSVESRADLAGAVKYADELKPLAQHNLDDIWTEIERRHQDVPDKADDLTDREFKALAEPGKARTGDKDFEATPLPTGPPGWAPLLDRVVAVSRLRETRALLGFTRIDAPEWGEIDAATVKRAPLTGNDHPTWVPAAVTRGEGIFLKLNTTTIAAWEAVAAASPHMARLRQAHRSWRHNRDMAPPHDDYWPGDRYLLLHTLSHLIIREIALECGYSSASITERVYAATENGRDEAGILLYTAASDSEGTLGGLVRLAQPAELSRILRAAFSNARRCSSDPLCGEHSPMKTEDSLHGAACHACLFASETSCQRGNRFLDRRLIAPLSTDEKNLDLLSHLGGLPTWPV